MFKQNNIGSQHSTRERQQQTAPHLTPRSPLSHSSAVGARFSALHGVCILLLITKALEEFKFKFEFEIQFEFCFVAFRFVSRFVSSLCVSFRLVGNSKRTIKPNAKGDKKKYLAKYVCGHLTSLEKRRKTLTAYTRLKGVFYIYK